MKPRNYQTAAINSVFEYYYRGNTGNPLICMPTGTGKSVVIAGFCRDCLNYFPGQRIMVLTHVKELVAQNHDKFLKMWPQAPAGIFSAGLNRKDYLFPVIFGGIKSVANYPHIFGKVDLLFIDEAHLVSPKEGSTYRKFIEYLLSVNPNLKVIGLTATPWRLGQGKIYGEEDSLFTDVSFDLTSKENFNWLLREGYLTPLVPHRPETQIDPGQLPMRGGEFIEKDVQTLIGSELLLTKATHESVELGVDRNKWVFFVPGVDNCEFVTNLLQSLGVETRAVHSKIKKKERDANINDFLEGRVKCLVNNNILTTGFDCDEIDFIVCLRPTMSIVLWIQMLGRGIRPLFADGFDLDTTQGRLDAIAAGPKQNTLVLDFTANTKRLGPINDPHIPSKKGKKKGEAPVKVCDTCNNYNHASARFCDFCGAEFQFDTHINQTASTEDLIKQDEPVVEEFKVDHITYERHHRIGKPPSLKVSYGCGIRLFKEFVLLEHPNMRKKAVRWWRDRANGGITPETVTEGLDKVGSLQTPTHIRVWTNKQYPEILACCYDGTNFGSEEPDLEVPNIQVYGSVKKSNNINDLDGDIPF